MENGGDPIVSWYWDFGDPNAGLENYSDLQNPTHIFTSSGNYNISLTSTNASGQ